MRTPLPLPPPPKKKKKKKRGQGGDAASGAAVGEPSAVSRSQRLAMIRRKADGGNGSVPAVGICSVGSVGIRSDLAIAPGAMASGDIRSENTLNPLGLESGSDDIKTVEMVTMGGDSKAADKIAKGAAVRPPLSSPNPANMALSRRLAGTLCVDAALLCGGVIWTLILAHAGAGDPMVLDCQRIGFILPLCLFLGFICVAIGFRPAEQTGMKRAMRRRTFFAKCILMLLCSVAVAGAMIGYPQGLCDASCKCGLCRDLNQEQKNPRLGPQSFELDLVAQLELNQNESRALQTSSNTWGRAVACSGVETVPFSQSTNHRNNSGSCAGDGISPSKVCDIENPDVNQRKIVLTSGISADKRHTVSAIFDSFVVIVTRDMTAKARANLGATYTHPEDFLKNDGSDIGCVEEMNPYCPEAKYARDYFELRFGRDVLVPTLCDNVYRFCDRKNESRLSCPQTTCCKMCNAIKMLDTCPDFEPTRDSILQDVKKRILERYSSWGYSSSDLSAAGVAYGVDAGLVQDAINTTHWSSDTILGILSKVGSDGNFQWDSCMLSCVDSGELSAPWYGKSPECLAVENRSWTKNATRRITLNKTEDSMGEIFSTCTCDADMRAWTESVFLWHGFAVFMGVCLLGLQTWIAVMVDHEVALCGSKLKKLGDYGSKRYCSWPLVLSTTLSSLLIGCLATQLIFVAAATRGTSCYNREAPIREELTEGDMTQNSSLMWSWALLDAFMLWIVMFAIVLPNVRAISVAIRGGNRDDTNIQDPNLYSREKKRDQVSDTQGPASSWWQRCASVIWWCAQKLKLMKHAYDDAFSFKNGRYYMYLRIISETVEVGTQAGQLISFSHERPFTWVSTLSSVTALNGVTLASPFLLARCFPICKRETRLIIAMLDTLFDVLYLLLAVIFSDRKNFGDSETWWVATLGILIPIASLTRRQRSMGRAMASRRIGFPQSPGKSENYGHAVENDLSAVRHDGNSRATIVLSLILSVACIACGTTFMVMAEEGDAACRSMLGDALWEGSQPRYVIAKSDGSGLLHGYCNFSAIRSIQSVITHGDQPLRKLPIELAQLERLESLVLSGHLIASDGVPAKVLDGVTLSRLTRLEFGKEDPVRHDLNLRDSSAAYLDVFPRHVLRFMTELESLRLRGSNISCFPPSKHFSNLTALRHLDLSGSKITYLPPSVLFEHPSLFVNLSGTPIWWSRSLDWSDHGLGSKAHLENTAHRQDSFGNKGFQRVAYMLPMLKSLNLSGNGLTDASALHLSEWPGLEIIDVSRNPSITPPASESSFSWWQVLSEHPTLGNNARFVGLANVGLGPNHILLRNSSFDSLNTNVRPNPLNNIPGLTCQQLRWMNSTMTSPMRVDLRGNEKFSTFVEWEGVSRATLECDCISGPDCSYVDDAVFRLFLSVLPNAESVHTELLFQKDIQDYSSVVSLQNLLAASSSKLQALTMKQNWLSGPIPSVEFVNLPNIRILHLSNNILSGSLSGGLFMCAKLQGLYLDGNQLSGQLSPQFSLLSNLGELTLAHNKFSGTLPEEIFTLRNLRNIDLGTNNFTGALSENISALSNLKKIRIEDNHFSGLIPTDISRLTKLNSLALYSNEFSGPIPASIAELTGLQYLGLQDNNLTGKIPDLWGLKEIELLDLSGNNLIGPIPNISDCQELQSLRLQDNKLVGEIPISIGALTKLTAISLSSNGLYGEIPDSLSALIGLRELHLEDNPGLHGALPESISTALTMLKSLTLPRNVTARDRVGSLCILSPGSPIYKKCTEGAPHS